MSEYTENLGLELTGSEEDDLEATVQSWRLGLSGTISGSNMRKIDEWAGEVSGSLTYTDTTPATVTLGGISKGDNLSGKSVADVLNMLLCPYVEPAVTIKANSAIHEVGVSTSRTLTVTATKGSNAITSVKITSGSTVYTLSAAEGAQTKSVTVSAASATYTASVTDGTSTVTASVTLTGVNPFYYGVVSSAPTASAGVKALTKLVQSKGSKTLSFTTTSSAGRYCFAYPASYGTLSSIKDGSGFDNTSAFTKASVSVTNAASTSVNYYVYTYNQDNFSASMTFTFAFA